MPLGVGRGQNVGLREFCLILTLLPGASMFLKHMSSFASMFLKHVKHMSSFSTIRGFYVLILNNHWQWLLMSNNHEKSRIQVRISTVIRFRVINLNFSCRSCLILQTYHRISSVWSSISIFTSKVITFGLTSFCPDWQVCTLECQLEWLTPKKKISRTLIEYVAPKWAEPIKVFTCATT